MSNNNHFLGLGRNNALSVVLDEPILFLGKSTGTKIIRGEVIVNFSKDTSIQGPITLVFQGIQTYYPWRDIMNGRALGKPIETKLHVTELSLLPPNSKGIMPAGIQRFPFEFPVPGSLPSTLSIPDRLDIVYNLTATLRRSNEDSSLTPSFLDRFNKKPKTVATARVRLVRAIELTPPSLPPALLADEAFNNNEAVVDEPRHPSDDPLLLMQEDGQRTPSSTTTSNSADEDITMSTATNNNNSTTVTNNDETHPQHRRTSLDRFYGIGLDLDEQHDHLANSFAGRTVEDWYHQPKSENGLRYRISIDRTAIAIGTRVGVTVLLEPTVENITIRSIVTRIQERREYCMKTPGDHASAIGGKPETRSTTETLNVLLKWAYGKPTQHDENSSCAGSNSLDMNDPNSKQNQKKRKQQQQQQKQGPVLDRRYRHHRRNWSNLEDNNTARRNVQLFRQKVEQERGDVPLIDYCHESSNYSGSSTTGENIGDEDANALTGELLNLKSLDQPLQVGEYFEGRFIMPIPTCNHLLRPTMSYESITIRHWLHLIVAYECDGNMYEVTLTTPVRILDCRLVSEDERQTILPPPPSYETIEAGKDPLSTNNTEFWLQRSSITKEAFWGRCKTCPCLKETSDKENGHNYHGGPNAMEKQRSLLQQKKKTRPLSSSSSSRGNFTRNRLSLHRLSGNWSGSPPAYSQN
ncbi:hypothetical protein BDA99DRAFT_516206 [Phascolomyces articulosus]|uniref:Arrestin C-terminal-like domain-containing protein n=1 Tax=Phascolomyces articulosus TaxID=60185 RepID=A0AAD5K9K8_9FUNG|nr:hypothetical protein BDA99DRAFT_516206 [Phascolomyces articulosus]